MIEIVEQLEAKTSSIGIIGLGYVGLPLACLFSTKYQVVGFDTDQKRINELNQGHDKTGEIENLSLYLSNKMVICSDINLLADCSIFIVTVPTPVDQFRKPDLSHVISSSIAVGSIMKKGSIIVFESTVYPGVTEGQCRIHLEEASGLKYGEEFFLGYSPERVNPGDKQHTIESITKIVSGTNEEVVEILAQIYGSVIKAGIFKAPSIATAEAAKVIENTQRDINIALINELAMIFNKIGLDTLDVLEAAGTKWNFLPFFPGLVGGHCIGIDPFYLTYLAEGVGIHPQIISSGRRINDGMAQYIANKSLGLILKSKNLSDEKIKIAVMGVAFKENIPDLRNSKSIDIVEYLEESGTDVYIIDPVVDPGEFQEQYNRSLIEWDELPVCDGIILAVKHDKFINDFPLPRLLEKLTDSKVIIDIKGTLDREQANNLGVNLWRL